MLLFRWAILHHRVLFAVDLSTLQVSTSIQFSMQTFTQHKDNLQKMTGKTPDTCQFESLDQFIQKARLIYENSVKFNSVNLNGTYNKKSIHGATVDFHKAVEKAVSSLRDVAKVEQLLSKAQEAARIARMEGFEAVPQATQLQLADGVLADVLSRPSHKPFFPPVTGLAKYSHAIPRRRCLQDVARALHTSPPQYDNIVSVVNDIRLVFGNAVEFNISPAHPYRKKAVTELDALCDICMAHPLLKAAPGGVRGEFHAMKQSRKLLEELLSDTDSKQMQRFWQFAFRIEYSFEGQRPPRYDEFVSKPMWLGRVAHLLYTRAYNSAGEMVSDLLRTASNAEAYWQPGRGGAAPVVLADAADLRARIGELCEKHLGMSAQGVIAQGTAHFALPEAASRGQKRQRDPAPSPVVLAESRSSAHDIARIKAQSAAVANPAVAPAPAPAPAAAAAAAAAATAVLPGRKMHKYTPRLTSTKPRLSPSGRDTMNTCMNMMKNISEHMIDSSHSKATVLAGTVFGQPVDLSVVPDYLTVIKEPMDFSTVMKKLHNMQYRTVDDWKKDVLLVFDNCVKYNSDLIAGADMRHIANSTSKRFKSMFEFTFPYTEGVDFYEGPRYTPTPVAPKPAPPRMTAAPPSSMPAPAAVPARQATSTFGGPAAPFAASDAAAHAFASVPAGVSGAPAAPAPTPSGKPRLKLNVSGAMGSAAPAPVQGHHAGPVVPQSLPSHLSSLPTDSASRQSVASASSFMPPPSPAMGERAPFGLNINVKGSANASAGADTPTGGATPTPRARLKLKAGVQPGMAAHPAVPTASMHASSLSQLPPHMQILAKGLIEQGSSAEDALSMMQRMLYATAMHSATASAPTPTPVVEDAPSGVKLHLKSSTSAANAGRASRRAAARKSRVTLHANGGEEEDDDSDSDSDIFDDEEDEDFDAEARFLNKMKRERGQGRRGSSGSTAAPAKRTPKPKTPKVSVPTAIPTPAASTVKKNAAAPAMSADGMPIYRSSRYRGRGPQTFDGGLPPLPADMARLEWVGAAKGALRQLRIAKFAGLLAHLELPIPAGEDRLMRWEAALEAKGVPENERLRLRWQDTNEHSGALVWRVLDLDFVEHLLDPTKSFTTATNGTMRKTISDKERARIEKAHAEARARKRKTASKKSRQVPGGNSDMVAYDSDDIEAGEEGNFGEMLDLDIVSHFEHPLHFQESVMKAFSTAESLFAPGLVSEPDPLGHAMQLRVKFLRDLWAVLWDEWVGFAFDVHAAARKDQRLARRALEAEAAPIDDAGTKLINLKILKRLKGGKNKNKAYYFLDYIENSFGPELWEMYSAVVPRPMDFPKVEDALTGAKYKTYGDCLRDIRLIFTNAIKFNARSVDLSSRQVVRAAEDLLEEVDTLWSDNAWLPWLEAHASKFEKDLHVADRAVRSDFALGYDLHSTYIIAQKKPVKPRTLALLHIENERQQEAEARRQERRALNGEDSDSRVDQSDIGGSGSSRGGRSDSEAEVFDEEPSDDEHVPLGGGQFDGDIDTGRLGSKRRRRLTARGRKSLRGADITHDSEDEDASVAGDFNHLDQDDDEEDEYDELDDHIAEESAPRERGRNRNLGAARVASGAGTVSDVLENAVDAMMDQASYQKSMRALPAQGGKSGTLLDEVMGALVQDVLKPAEVDFANRKAHESTGSDTLGGKNARVVALKVIEQLLHSRRLPWELEASELGRGSMGAQAGEDSVRTMQLSSQVAYSSTQQQSRSNLLRVVGVPDVQRVERMSAASQLPPSLQAMVLQPAVPIARKPVPSELMMFEDDSEDESGSQAPAGPFKQVQLPGSVASALLSGAGSPDSSASDVESQQPSIDLPLQSLALYAGMQGSTLLFVPPCWTAPRPPQCFTLGLCAAPQFEASAVQVHSLAAKPSHTTSILSVHPQLAYVTLAVSIQPGEAAPSDPVDWTSAVLRFVSDASRPELAHQWKQHVAWLSTLQAAVVQHSSVQGASTWGTSHNPHLATPQRVEGGAADSAALLSMDDVTARQLSALASLDFVFMPSLGCYLAVCGSDTPIVHLIGFADTLSTTLEES